MNFKLGVIKNPNFGMLWHSGSNILEGQKYQDDENITCTCFTYASIKKR